MFFNDTEIFRTSTAEPTRTGITWTYVKDMSNFLILFREPQKIIFDLGNLVDDTYTGLWNTTLTATFFTAQEVVEPADLILPVSTHRSVDNAPSAFVVPKVRAVNSLSLPRNIKKAVFTISACGQASEEFWWSNVLTSDIRAFGNETTLYGHSAFRELRLLIDGNLAGVAWPFPVVFTGGIVPGFWRPVVGIDAFDLREDEIDISPFLPRLTDGNEHSFEIQVLGIDDNGQGIAMFTTAIESNWVVTGKIFLWLDHNANTISGGLPSISAPEPTVSLQSVRNSSGNGTTKSLDYSIEVVRNLHIESTLHTLDGPKTVSWTQHLTFSNSGNLGNQGNDQKVQQRTSIRNTSPFTSYVRSADYPLEVESSYNAPVGGNLTIAATMSRAKNVRQSSDLAFPNEWKTFDLSRLPANLKIIPGFTGSNVQNQQSGTASYLSIPAQKVSYSAGKTEQLYVLSGQSDSPTTVVQSGLNAVTGSATRQAKEELYRRHILAENDTIVYDDETFGKQLDAQHRPTTFRPPINAGSMHEFAGHGIRALLGRGPQ
ncbi:hypothetical protein ACN47E_006077 [Coniothyrium glycines]